MDRFHVLDVLTPSGTQTTAPLLTEWTMEDAWLEWIEIVVPDGHNGLTGIAIMAGSQLVIPWAGADFIVANDDKILINWRDYVNTAMLSINSYNMDIFPHTFYLRALVTDYPHATQAQTGGSASPPISDLGGTLGGTPIGIPLPPGIPPIPPPVAPPGLPGGPEQPGQGGTTSGSPRQQFILNNG
ncbi:MAG: hypothetical protein ACREQ5_01635 [Candidatus Dormibacteria bacterium]